MAKRSKLEIIRDILEIIKESHNCIKITPLIRKSNLSTSRFKEYYLDIIQKSFIIERIKDKAGKCVSLTDKGLEFIEKYKTIIQFIDEFGL